MDDIMVLFHKMVVDLVAFDESQFGIFNEHERVGLKKMYEQDASSSAVKFLTLLSPDQKQRVALWACERSSYSVPELITALEKFTKCLKTSASKVYPKKKTRGKLNFQ
jgi:hypothetical protein